MHLDETILQSKTTMNLVKFIDELMKIALDVNGKQMSDDFTYTHIMGKYEGIKKLHDKAMIKRNKPYRKKDE